MRKATLVLALSLLGVCVAAQAGDPNPSDTTSSHAKKPKDKITAVGCVSKLNTDYVLIQADQGNTYELQGSHKLRLAPYLGQQVEVTGIESPSLSTSSDYLARNGSASPVTITVISIKTIAKRCSAN